ncbi:hypothetical protein BpHYR1_016726 [Brachionus plicatilis]|uniref:Uncharacterized protein n=1 Tax=Brachionus plicatilis TaxID=10195 RepID=A0A3M7QL33_BRAPC|nr:hypothetical protein BpHYR1_016726 [Brachionus plicatilis]
MVRLGKRSRQTLAQLSRVRKCYFARHQSRLAIPFRLISAETHILYLESFLNCQFLIDAYLNDNTFAIQIFLDHFFSFHREKTFLSMIRKGSKKDSVLEVGEVAFN